MTLSKLAGVKKPLSNLTGSGNSLTAPISSPRTDLIDKLGRVRSQKEREKSMRKKDRAREFPLCADEAPQVERLTKYDKERLSLYTVLISAIMEKATEEEVCKELFYIDPEAEPERAHKMYKSHVSRAQRLGNGDFLRWLFIPPQRASIRRKGK